jgi:hypothetical protein
MSAASSAPPDTEPNQLLFRIAGPSRLPSLASEAGHLLVPFENVLIR